MARMHSRKKGKSGSNKPSKKTIPSWVRYKPKELELLITKLAKEGNSPSQIGLHLRDTYGIPNIRMITKKRISAVLKGKNLLPEIPECLLVLVKRAVKLRKHIETNNKDNTATRGLILTESKIRRLVKYYKKTKRLPITWTYDPEKAKLLVS